MVVPMLLALSLVSPAEAAKNPYTASSVTLDLPAADGVATLPLRVSWPDGVKAAPVIVWSHGMGGSRDAYEALVRHWVEHGFVVLQPTHGDSIVNQTKEELAKYDSIEDFVKDGKNASSWQERPQQIARALDELDWIVAHIDGLEPDEIDAERIGVGGHSFGAHTAMLAGGLTLYPPASSPVQVKEDRADAILLISPQGTGPAQKAESYGTISPPVLLITGSEDRSARRDEGVEWRMEAWAGLPSEHAWLLFIDGATHSFGGIGGRPGAVQDAAIVSWVQQTTLEFWEAQLKGDRTSSRWLEGDDIEKTSKGRARLERKETEK